MNQVFGEQGVPRRSAAWPLIILASTEAVAVLHLAGVEGMLMQAAATWFIVVCPGMAIVHLLRLRDPLAEWTVAIGLSLGLAGVIAGFYLYVGAWSPPLIFGHLLAIATIASLADLAWIARQRGLWPGQFR